MSEKLKAAVRAYLCAVDEELNQACRLSELRKLMAEFDFVMPDDANILAENERLHNEIKRIREMWRFHTTTDAKIANERFAEVQRLRKVLEWYAAADNYIYRSKFPSGTIRPSVLIDEGERARKALEGKSE